MQDKINEMVLAMHNNLTTPRECAEDLASLFDDQDSKVAIGEDVREKLEALIDLSRGDCVTKLPALIDQLTALFLEHDQWLPIADAPKDGSEILCSEASNVFIIFWINDRWEDLDGMMRFPSHYMPLPKPPTKGE